MLAGSAFADILDEKLRGYAARRAPETTCARYAYLPPHPFLFRALRANAHPAAASTTAGVATGRRPEAPPPPKAAPHRAQGRTLTTRQQQAFDVFRAWGAALGPSFTTRDLRSAYRALARRYHPDRHPEADAVGKARAASQFAELREHYRHLTAACGG
jgi:hypothetical protein